MDELNPLFREIVQKPLAFAGGFVSGILHLSPDSDPLRNWIAHEAGEAMPTTAPDPQQNSGPQSIDIE
ncbi:hypothetical protein [Lyngbya confervoides]|uniref:hypothetical protein n=1 Tax=Lyngbya confervoides TaxID=207921 RepID=UPI0032D5A5A0